MEWFQRSMNHDRNSSTVTGQERKKHGPEKKDDDTRQGQELGQHVEKEVETVAGRRSSAYLSGSLKCCASPGMYEDDTRV